MTTTRERYALPAGEAELALRLSGAHAEIEQLRADKEKLTRAAVADRKGLARWCNYQDRLFAVMSSDEIRAFEDRLSEGGWRNEPLCRHSADGAA